MNFKKIICKICVICGSQKSMLSTTMLSVSSRQRDQDDSLNGVAYRKIKEKIVTLALPPASLIDEGRLADELEVGLTPVRQALRRLALEDLVVILPRRGTIVADLNSADLDKLFEMRVELETLAARLAAQRATPAQIAEMEAVSQEGIVQMLTANNRTLMELDHQMHLLLATAAHNEFLDETLEWLFSHVQRLWNMGLPRITSLPKAMQEHREIVKAVKARNGERAAELMRIHIQHFQQEFATL